jgi:hypothetical protein
MNIKVSVGDSVYVYVSSNSFGTRRMLTTVTETDAHCPRCKVAWADSSNGEWWVSTDSNRPISECFCSGKVFRKVKHV